MRTAVANLTNHRVNSVQEKSQPRVGTKRCKSWCGTNNGQCGLLFVGCRCIPTTSQVYGVLFKGVGHPRHDLKYERLFKTKAPNELVELA